MQQIIDCNKKYIEEIYNLEKQNFVNEFYTINDLNTFILNPMKLDFFKILIDNDILIGYIIYRINDICEIFKIFIKEQYRRNKFATILLQQCILDCKNFKMKQIQLEVKSNNINAIEFYYNNNFNKINIRKNYYGELDAIVMELNIGEE